MSILRAREAGVVAVLTSLMGAGPLLVYAYSVTGPLLIKDLGLSAVEFGLLTTTCYLGAGCGSAVMGHVSDSVATRIQLVIVFGGSAVAFALSVIPLFSMLLVASVISGIAQSMSNPATNRIVADLAPLGRAGVWIGIKQSGVQIGQLTAGVAFPFLATHLGWNAVAGASTILLLILLVLSLRNRTLRSGNFEHHTPDAQRGRRTVDVASRTPLMAEDKLPAVVWICAFFAFFSGLGLAGTNAYLPLFATRDMHFTMVVAGYTAIIAGAVGVLARIFWSSRMTRGGSPAGILLTLAIGALSGAVALAMAARLTSPALLWAGTVIHGATALGVSVVTMGVVLSHVARIKVGRASGLVAVGMYFGFAAGPTVMGIFVEGAPNFEAAWVAMMAAYLVCALLAGLFALLQRRTTDGHSF